MSQPWIAEERITTEQAAELIDTQIPALAPARLELLGEGWDNVAFLVNGTHVFRFPRRQIAVGLLERERTVLPLVARTATLDVPVPEYEGHPTETFRWPFLGYRLLSGRTLCMAHIREEQRAAVAEPLARFLRALHGIPVDEAKANGATPHFINKMDFSQRFPAIEKNLTTLRAKGIFTDVDPFLREIANSPPPRDTPEALCHGDLYVRHLIVNDATQLSGVIDWGDLHLGDPTVDLISAHLVLPPELHPTFRAHYGTVSDGTWQRARLLAIFHASTTAVYGADISDENLLRESLWALRSLLRISSAA